MIRKRRVINNAALSVAQVVVTGAAFFFLYGFVERTIGIEDFGVWALVLAATSVAGVANLGIASSGVKFVAMYLARGDGGRVVQVIQTAVLSTGCVLGLVLLAAYPLLREALTWFVEPLDKLPAALSILPYALLSFWLNAAGAVLQSCVDGLHRVALRNGLLMANVLFYLLLVYLLVPRHGLLGLAWAQSIQAGSLVLGMWLILRRLRPGLPVLPYQWSRSVFREIIGYALNYQVVSVSQFLLEPATKLLLSRFGGLAALGFFEFAHRMVFQLRALIVSAHQSFLPAIAELQERQPDRIHEVYRLSFRLLLFLVVPLLPLLMALTPLVSRVWIGRYEPDFVLFAALVFVGWFVNVTSGPAYFGNLGTGELRWNVWSHLLTSALNVTFAVLFGTIWGAQGVVAGFALALVVGSLTLTLAYHVQHGIRFRQLVEPGTLLLGACSLTGALLVLAIYRQLAADWSWASLGGVVLAVYLAVVCLPFWLHPMRRRVQAWLSAAWLQGRPEFTSAGR